MSFTEDTNWGKKFVTEAAQQLASYSATMNYESQAIAINSNAENIQSTGTKQCMINGVYIPVLAADAELDISADTTTITGMTNAVGISIADGYDQYFLILAKADGTLSMWKAGDAALLGTATIKVPAYDPETYVAVATALIVNNSGNALIVGTTALTGDITFYNVIGPLYPHPDNLKRN